MTDFNQFQVDSVIFPLPTGGQNSLLRDADPALYFALDFWTFVINQYLGQRLVQETSADNLPLLGNAVKNSYPFDPLPEYLEDQIKFPALFAYRTTAHTEQWTAGWDHDLVEFELIYALPPLDADAAYKLLPALPAIAKAIRKKTSDAWDPAYTPPGGNLGDQFDAAPYANLQEIGFGPAINRRIASTPTRFYRIGKLPGTGNQVFPCVILNGYFIERDAYNPTQGGPSKFLGADITGNVKGDDGTVVPAPTTTVVQASTTVAPTISGLTTTTGPAAGGTAVTIEGNGFQPGPPMVFFGPANDPQYATSVQYQSAGLLVAVTPPMQGAGTVDVTVVNRDGQSVTLQSGFTFT